MADRLRVALISEHASPLAPTGSEGSGGQTVYVAEVARCLAAAGHHVDVLTRRDDESLPAVVDWRRGVRVLHLDAGPARTVLREDLLEHMPAFAESARRLLARGAPYDVMHANFFMSGWVGLALRQRFTLPLVTSLHGLGLVRRAHQRSADHFPAERVEIERALVAQSDRVLASCPQDESDLMRLYGAPPERISCVPHGVDCTAFRPGDRGLARRKLGLPEGEFILLCVGRVVPRKGIDNVLRAMAAMAQATPEQPARLIVVGGDSEAPDAALTPEIGRLRQLAQALGVGERVQFVGRRRRENLRDWYLAADVLVSTPWYEPFGLAPLEAMACGTAVVGSAVGGIRSTVVEGVTGLLVPPREPGVLAERLLQLQRHPARAAAMGRAGVRRARLQFSWEQVAARLVRVYAAVGARAAVSCVSLPVVLERPRIRSAERPAAELSR